MLPQQADLGDCPSCGHKMDHHDPAVNWAAYCPICKKTCSLYQPTRVWSDCSNCGDSWSGHLLASSSNSLEVWHCKSCLCEVRFTSGLRANGWRQPDDPVNHPEHYTSHPSGVECITVTEHMNFCLGNAIKYLWRQGQKPGVANVEDLRKAIWYIEREIVRIERNGH